MLDGYQQNSHFLHSQIFSVLDAGGMLFSNYPGNNTPSYWKLQMFDFG